MPTPIDFITNFYSVLFLLVFCTPTNTSEQASLLVIGVLLVHTDQFDVDACEGVKTL